MLSSRLVAILLGLLVASGAAAVSAAERGPMRAGAAAADESARVIVRFKPGTVRERALAFDPRGAAPALQMARPLSIRRGITLADGPSIDGRTQVMLAQGVTSRALADKLAADADVEWVEVDRRQRIAAVPRVVPDDALYAGGQPSEPVVGQWYLRAPDATAVAAVDAEAAWAVTKGRASIVVAVVDTGVRPEHPDLAGKLLPGYDFVSPDGAGDFRTANDGDGRDADPSDPGDWITALENAGGLFKGCADPYTELPSTWHGTQVAGLVGAATDNVQGVAGAGWNLKVLPVRALGKCGGRVSDIVAGMRWAAGLSVPGVPANPNPARVVNLSLGSPNRCDAAYQEAIDELNARGVVVVSAAGNEGVSPNQPGNCRGVVTVAGVRHVGTKVGYSSLGLAVALAAPAGNCVNDETGPCLYPLMTTSNAGATGPAASTYTGSGADAALGTSFSSPLVAATAGLMLSANPSLEPEAVTRLLKSSARAFPPPLDPAIPLCRAPSGFDDEQLFECHCTTTTCGAGMLDAGASVIAAQAVPVPPPSAVIAVQPSRPAPGEIVTLDGGASTAARGFAIAGYRWAIVGGTAASAFTSATDGPVAQLQASTTGSVVVRLTVTDSRGVQASTTSEFAVERPDSGGGASGPGWILALALATFALRRAKDRRPR
jgi:serine protease